MFFPKSDLRNFNRSLIGAAGLAYLLWWGVVELLLSGSFNPLGSRLAVVFYCWTIFALSFVLPAVLRKIEFWLLSCLWLITLHYFYLFHFNQADINWVVGAYITVIAVGACINTERALLSYAFWVIFLSLVITFLDRVLLQTIYFPGMVTILAFSYLGLLGRKRSEQDRIRYEASQKAIQMRDEFLSIASHELKTPLTNLKLQAQVALRNLGKEGSIGLAPEKVRWFFEQTDKQVDRLTRLVQEMLDMTQISADKLTPDWEVFDLAGLVQEVTKMFDAFAKQSGSALELDLPNLPNSTLIRADRFRMEQVVSNLLSNAIKYGNKKPIRIWIESTDRTVSLGVRDQGIGIAKEHHERIFQRFERGIDSCKIGGLGLGLYISKNIVEKLGGKITLTSQPDQGACFTVVLPQVSD